MHYICDDNAEQWLADHAGRFEGEGLGLIPRDYSRTPLSSLPYTAPFSESVPIIPKAEWPDRIKAMQGRFIRNVYTGTPEEDNQSFLSYCWTFSLTQAVKGQRDRDGQPHVDLLAEAAGRDVGFRNVGNYCGSAIKCAAEFGYCDRSFSPQRYNLRPSTWKQGWEEEAKNHRVLEFWELGHVDMWQETVTALLLGYGVYVGLNWLSHAMWFDEVQLVNGIHQIHTPNTWGAGQDMMLSGRKAIPDEAYVVRVGTWSNT